MQVSEAKEKICPFLHLATQHRNNGEIYFSYTYCQTTKCMAWVDTTEKEVCEGKIIKKIYPKPEPQGHCARIGL